MDTKELAISIKNTIKAHHKYQTEEMGGVRNHKWATWYATFLFESNKELASMFSKDKIRDLLNEANDYYKRIFLDPASHKWSDEAADYIIKYIKRNACLCKN